MKRKIVSTKRNKKSSRRELLLNMIVAALFGGVMIWMGYSAFQTASSDNKKNEGYRSSLPSLQDTIPHEKVCMVDDVYQGDFKTVSVILSRKLYYGCDFKAINDLSNDQNLRVARDPVSKREVDKASAIIAIHPNRDGTVLYFESEETYHKYLSTLKAKP